MDIALAYMGAGIGFGLTVIGAGIGIGRLAAAIAEGVARQPSASGPITGAALNPARQIETEAFKPGPIVRWANQRHGSLSEPVGHAS